MILHSSQKTHLNRLETCKHVEDSRGETFGFGLAGSPFLALETFFELAYKQSKSIIILG